jgi:hypothetical protein
MKIARDGIVADGAYRIHDSKGFKKRKNELRQAMILRRSAELEVANWFKKRLILWSIDRDSEQMAVAELCPPGALYFNSK